MRFNPNWNSFLMLREMEQMGKVGFALAYFLVLLAVSIAISLIVFSWGFGGGELNAFILGIVIWLFWMKPTLPDFLVSVPEYTVLVTVNLLREDQLEDYRTGIHFRYPWEQVKVGNYINTRLEQMDREEDYPARDGPKMRVKWQVHFQIVNAVTFMKVGLETIETFLTGIGSGLLGATIYKKGSKRSKNQQQQIEVALTEKFANLKTIESYGVEVTKVVLVDIDYEDTVQKVLATQFVAKKVKEIGKDFREGQQEINPKDSLNAAMIIHGDYTKHINEVEGEGGNALAALLMGMAQGGGRKQGNEKKEGKK
ncbi:MAG TPA: SPFH domain-containing protein [Candidatus Paceibacterota bacterium]